MIKNVSLDLFKRDYNTTPPPNSLCISIMNSSDTESDYFPLNSEWASRLRVTFDDINEPVQGMSEFTYEHAVLILKVVLDDQLNIKDEYDNIIIHCTAGVSRSAAIALFFNQLKHRTTITDLSRFGWSCFNSYVFVTLLEAFHYKAEELGLPNYLERVRV